MKNELKVSILTWKKIKNQENDPSPPTISGSEKYLQSFFIRNPSIRNYMLFKANTRFFMRIRKSWLSLKYS